MDKNDVVFIAGHNGMVGKSIYVHMAQSGFNNIITKSRSELDLCSQQEVEDFFSDNKVDCVILAAAKVGGIFANNEYPAEFIYENLMMESNVIHQAYKHGVKKLLFLGSSCIYPKLAEQPMRESALLTGELEPTNEPYAIAKIAGIKLCESYNRQYNVDYRSIMPTNLYGPGDNFHPENSHVIPALIRRLHDAKESSQKEVAIWGTGNPKREFLHVEDMAAASLFVLSLNKDAYDAQTKPTQSHLNVGSGVDVSIGELASTIAQVIGYRGELIFDTSKPDGSPRKLMDVSLINKLGWSASIDLKTGLAETYGWFLREGKVNNLRL